MRPADSPGTRRTGILLAVITAVISGVAVFINGYGVRAWAGTASPTSYTTFKNGVAAFVLLGLGLALTRRRSGEGFSRPGNRRQWFGLGLVAALGGALAFALFFEGPDGRLHRERRAVVLPEDPLDRVRVAVESLLAGPEEG